MVTVTWGLAVQLHPVIREPVCPPVNEAVTVGFADPRPRCCALAGHGSFGGGRECQVVRVPELQLQVSARFLVGTVHQPAQRAVLAQSWDRFQSEFFICNNGA